jgi:hypothetical protein
LAVSGVFSEKKIQINQKSRELSESKISRKKQEKTSVKQTYRPDSVHQAHLAGNHSSGPGLAARL